MSLFCGIGPLNVVHKIKQRVYAVIKTESFVGGMETEAVIVFCSFNNIWAYTQIVDNLLHIYIPAAFKRARRKLPYCFECVFVEEQFVEFIYLAHNLTLLPKHFKSSACVYNCLWQNE